MSSTNTMVPAASNDTMVPSGKMENCKSGPECSKVNCGSNHGDPIVDGMVDLKGVNNDIKIGKGASGRSGLRKIPDPKQPSPPPSQTVAQRIDSMAACPKHGDCFDPDCGNVHPYTPSNGPNINGINVKMTISGTDGKQKGVRNPAELLVNYQVNQAARNVTGCVVSNCSKSGCSMRHEGVGHGSINVGVKFGDNGMYMGSRIVKK
jgi:hypothetical protein